MNWYIIRFLHLLFAMIRLLLLNMAIVEPMNNGIMNRHPDALQIWNFLPQ